MLKWGILQNDLPDTGSLRKYNAGKTTAASIATLPSYRSKDNKDWTIVLIQESLL